MKRVYISKSKNSNYDDLLKLRSELRKFNDIETIEYTGGTYSTKQLESCDYCIVVPPNITAIFPTKYNGYDHEINPIGKGQYCEFEVMDDLGIDACLFHKDTFYETFYIRELNNAKDFNIWAKLYFDSDSKLTLEEFFGINNKVLRETNDVIVNTQNKKLLLIKR